MNPELQVKDITLRELQPVLRSKLGDELIVDSFTTDSLVQPGENYGSTILSVNAVIRRNSKAEKEDLFLIAKMSPPTDFQKRIFDSPYTFRKEAFMYESILPGYNQLEIEQGVPEDQVFCVLPKYYGSRLSLDPNVDFDDDAVILLENLKVQGYYTGNRSEGYDYEHSNLAIRAMARFHALGIAVKQKKPEQFKIFRERSKCLNVQGQDFKDIHTHMLNSIKNDEVVGKHYERCEKVLHMTPEKMKELWQEVPQEPWATIVHADFWVNNIMFHRDENGKVDDVKFVDFQNYLYFNPIREMVFYLFLSTDDNTQENHADELMGLYYDTFIDTLTRMGCDTQKFSRSSFEKSIPQAAKQEFMHVCFMLKVITLDAKEIEFNMSKVKDVMVEYQGNTLYTMRLRRSILSFIERNWV